MKAIEEMRSRFSSGFSSSDKTKIEELYLLVCGKRVRNTGCSDCYRDAFIEIRSKLKQLKAMPKKPNYILKAGVIVHPQGTSKYYSLNNIPDDVAEEYLGNFPAEIANFETYPLDWESRVQARKEGKVHIPTYDELKAEVENLTAKVADKEKELDELKEATVPADEIEKLKAEIVEKDAKIAEVEGELSAAKEQVEAGKDEAQKEVGRLNGVIAEKDGKIAELEQNGKKSVEEAVAAAKKEVTDAMNKVIAETKKELLAAKDAVSQKDAEIEKLKAEIAAATKQEPEKK